MNETQADSPTRRTVQRMTERLLTGEMNHEEFEYFETLLMDDYSARQVYIEQVNLHSQLSYLGGAVEILGDKVTGEQESFLSRHALKFTIVACALCVCVLMNAALPLVSLFKNAPEQGSAAGHSIAATIGSLTVDHVSPGSSMKENPRRINAGELLQLPAGRSRIRLNNGVRCILTGSARLQFRNESEVDLFTGHIVADVPRNAIGFRINTRQGQIIDLGTTFSVSTDQTERSDIMVFSGEVAAYWRDKKNTLKPWLIQSGEGVRFQQHRPPETIPFLTDSVELSHSLMQLYGLQSYTDECLFLTTPPVSLKPHSLASDEHIFVFQESGPVELTSPVRVIPGVPRTLNSGDEIQHIELPAGICCSSFLMHADFIKRGKFMKATVRFDRPILGIIVHAEDLQMTDRFFAHRSTEYPTDEEVLVEQGSRGCLLPFGNAREVSDQIVLHEDQMGLTATLFAPADNIDQIRILIQAETPPPINTR